MEVTSAETLERGVSAEEVGICPKRDRHPENYAIDSINVFSTSSLSLSPPTLSIEHTHYSSVRAI